MTEREFATEVVARLQEAGFEALFAGGCVRDELLGREPADYDIATAATPDDVKRLFRRCNFFGASFGVVEVMGPRPLKVQVATFRSDGTYSDGRRPDAVTFSSPAEDAARRDFTINGLFLDPRTGRVIDYVNGEADLRAKVLRAIGDPAARFAEDKLRILRAVRMAARFELEVDPATLAAGRAMAPLIAAVSAERIAEELRKILANEHRVRGVRLAGEFGLLPHILPEVADAERAATTIAALHTPPFPLALVSLLPDLDHPRVLKLCGRLKLSNDERDRVAWLAKHRHAFDGAASLPKSTIYPLLAHAGGLELYELHSADGYDRVASSYILKLLHRTPLGVLDPPALVTGDDLVAAGFRPGPAFKRTLDAIRTLQLDGHLRDRSEAIAKAAELLR